MAAKGTSATASNTEQLTAHMYNDRCTHLLRGATVVRRFRHDQFDQLWVGIDVPLLRRPYKSRRIRLGVTDRTHPYRAEKVG